MLIALDPGPELTGFCLYDGQNVERSGVLDNQAMIDELNKMPADELAIEMIASYGMPVGREVFETCVWIGRFVQAWKRPGDVRLIYRREVKLHLCGTAQANDANVRRAIIDLFPRTGGGKTPQIGVKDQPGPLYGVSTHAWAALGVAVTAFSRR